VVAVVGEARIIRAQVERMISGLDRPELSPSELQQEAIEELIAQELLFQEAKQRNIQVTEAEIFHQMDLLWREFLSRSEFEEKQQEHDLDKATLHRQTERELAIMKLLDQEVYAGMAVGDADMVKRPREVHELYIFRRVYPGASEAKSQDAWEKMRQAHEKVMAGEDFGEVVKEYSQSGLAKWGGDAGFVTYNPNSTVSKALFTLEEGQISEIIETRWGLFILKAEEIRPERMQAFGEMGTKLQRIVLQRRMRERLDSFVEELKGKTDVELTS
ncbi:peptidylprolyl isomerase, partial [Candidatus Zixiibacteriota bacterium]